MIFCKVPQIKKIYATTSIGLEWACVRLAHSPFWQGHKKLVVSLESKFDVK
jgi:hypothetical protein